MKKIMCTFIAFSVSFQTFGMSNAELNGKFCSNDRVKEYKKIIKSHYKKISKCLEKFDYKKCKETLYIGFSISQESKRACYIILSYLFVSLLVL